MVADAIILLSGGLVRRGDYLVEKEDGKLSEEQFRRLIQKLPEMRAADGEIRELLRSTSKEKLQALLKDGESWAELYELPFAEHVAHVLVALGQEGWIG